MKAYSIYIWLHILDHPTEIASYRPHFMTVWKYQTAHFNTLLSQSEILPCGLNRNRDIIPGITHPKDPSNPLTRVAVCPPSKYSWPSILYFSISRHPYLILHDSSSHPWLLVARYIV